LAAAKLRDVIETLEHPPDGVRASRRLVMARDRTRKYSVPVEGTFEHCIKKLVPRLNNGTNDTDGTNGTNGTNGTDGTIVKTCADWHETVENMYKAREVFRDNVALNASFGSRDALASMVSGAISAATMNITEYVTEENSYIQIWKQEITSARNTFVAIRGIANGALFLGGIACGVLGPAECIPATIGVQALQWGLEYPTFKTSEEIDNLLNDEYNRADSYLSEKGKQVKELTKFLRTIVAMNETHIAPLVYLGGVFTSYVALTVASNATKTAADVHSDLDGILGGDDLDADVKTLAGMLFDDTPPPDVLDSFSYLRWVRILPSIGAILTSLILLWKINGVFKQHARYAAELALMNAMTYVREDVDGTQTTFYKGVLVKAQQILRAAQRDLDYSIALIGKLDGVAPLTEGELDFLGVPRDLVKKVVDGKYTFLASETRELYRNVVVKGRVHIEALDRLQKAVNDKTKDVDNYTIRVRQLKRATELRALTEDRPSLEKIAGEKKWYKNGAKGIIALTLVSVAVDGIITLGRVNQINDFIDSVVSSRTSTLETTAGVLGAWQELHTLT
jgi:hypothetical protein